MTRDDIIRMAREAGIGPIYGANDESLERFAHLVAAACAKVCEDKKVGFPSYFEIDERIQECADAIRARKENNDE